MVEFRIKLKVLINNKNSGRYILLAVTDIFRLYMLLVMVLGVEDDAGSAIGTSSAGWGWSWW